MTPGYQAFGSVSWRSLAATDLPPVYELEAAGEAFDSGVAEVSMSDLEADWSRPDFHPEALVHPEHRGRGLGRFLAEWTWSVARSEGRDRVGQTISDNETAAAALFSALGYERGHAAWILRIDLSGTRNTPELPTGYRFRSYRPGAAVGRDYEASGEGWIEQMAVHRAHRGLGLGAALLAESFSRFRAMGRARAAVSTDSRTGALRLYEHAGMAVVRCYTRWVKSGL